MSDGGTQVLDVGCATGALCAAYGVTVRGVLGLDLNPRFIEAARANDPDGEYRVGDMRKFRWVADLICSSASERPSPTI